MITDIIQTIDAFAQQEPHRVCYQINDQTYDYQQLSTASTHLAQAIAGCDLPAKAPIMVYGDQSFATIVAFLACVKSGHAYIPVDTHSPQTRLTMIESIAKPALILAVADLPIAMQTPVLDARTQAIAGSRAHAAKLTPVTGDDTFYIIFTSGTTGQPKGVQISHNNLLSFVNWMNTFDLPEHAQVLSQAPYSFDLSVMGLYPALTQGGALKVMPQDQAANLKTLFAVLPTLALQVWISTPSFASICLLDANFDAAHYPDLTQFFFCGEELTHALAETLLQRFPQAQIYNTYGPTEATVAVTAVEITQAVLDQYSGLPIGVAKPDTKILLRENTLRDEDGQRVGELMIQGPSVSKGYLNNPDKTAAAFLPDGYATGDLGYIDDAGMIFYRGRTDFQIKLNGYRIELEEVNHYLNDAPLIAQGVAIPKYNREHKVAKLLAYIVPAKNEFESELQLTQAIRRSLESKMMSYMVPQRFVYRDALPLTANGKVAIKQLIAEVNA
ncbi:D-alanine--poly(phosphoribitol) ligase subunit DltA [Lacticaseibacillus porcinae]|uniref:D-alanine--poly(phosphoribitol) ligase subunit DltA n=1 Tax=Lacticaseibacillus porcinae TaxID=1123687 RepID=UPI000F76EB93|nr:D-alanine--poly(phosphoribitol) ligase subunit DltA [Lacticaseibacillus porcinae]